MPEEEHHETHADISGGHKKSKLGEWLKEHTLEAIGVVAGVIVLILILRSRGKSSVVAPAAGQPNSGGGTGGTGGGGTTGTTGTTGISSSDLNAALASLQATLSAAEQADVASLTAQLQQQSSNLAAAQASLKSDIAAAQAANNANLAAGLADQSAKLADLQSNLNGQIQGLQAGQASQASVVNNLSGQVNRIGSIQLGRYNGQTLNQVAGQPGAII